MVGFRMPRGLPIYLRVRGSDIGFRCCLMQYYSSGYQQGLLGVPTRRDKAQASRSHEYPCMCIDPKPQFSNAQIQLPGVIYRHWCTSLA
jgi:hypothetical protein